jgi:hypothetical protein
MSAGTEQRSFPSPSSGLIASSNMTMRIGERDLAIRFQAEKGCF